MGPKRNLTLDLNSQASKRLRSSGGTSQGGGGGGILTSPDVQRLKLNSPMVRDFLTNAGSGATPTPSGAPTAGYTFPPGAAAAALTTSSAQSEQELLVKQFDQAMNKGGAALVGTRASKQMSGGALLLPSTIAETVSSRPSSSSNASSGESGSLEIKQEPDELAAAPPQPSTRGARGKAGGKGTTARKNSESGGGGGGGITPIDMETQEQIKLDRKRQRNRLAATKCRKKKLEKISKLEVKVNELRGENIELGNVLKRLKDNVYSLKAEVTEHVKNGCHLDMSS